MITTCDFRPYTPFLDKVRLSGSYKLCADSCTTGRWLDDQRRNPSESPFNVKEFENMEADATDNTVVGFGDIDRIKLT